MPEVSIEQLQKQKLTLEKELIDFSHQVNTLDASIKEAKQKELQDAFSGLSSSIAEVLARENNEQIKTLQTEINQLKIKYQEILSWTKTETSGLNNDIEKQQYSKNELITNNLLEGTPLKTTMLSVFSHPDFDKHPELADKPAEKRLEFVFQKINITLTRFYARKLDISPEQPLPEHLTKVIIPATERFLMDLLKNNQQENNVNFLGQISEISLDKIWDIFQGVNDFAKKFTLPFTQGKALLNFSDFIALPKNRTQLSKLKNPYEFYEKVLQNPVWTKSFISTSDTIKDTEKQTKMSDISREQFWLSDFQSEQTPEELENALQAGQEKIKQELWSIQMVNSPATVKKMLGLLDTTDAFFEKTQVLKDQLLDKMDWVGKAGKILKSALGIDLWKEIKKMPFVWGVLNFVLSLLGFSWGIDGMERARKKRNIDRELKQPQKDYITETYKNYIEKKATDENTAKTVIDTYKLKIHPDKASKFALDLPLLKSEIADKLEEKPELMNLSTLNKIKTTTFKGEHFLEKVKVGDEEKLQLKTSLSPEQREQFIESYLQTMLEHFSKSKNSDALNALKDADALAFTMISWVVVDRENVIDGVEAQVLLPEQFYEKPKEKEEKTDSSPQDSSQEKTNTEIKWYEGTLMFYDKIPWTEADKKAFKEKVESISKELNINPNWLMAVMYKESAWSFSPSKQNPKWWAVWLIQFMPSTAKWLWTTTEQLKSMTALEQLDFVKKYYQGSSYNSLKDLYLKTFFPLALNYSNDESYIFKSSDLTAQEIANANPSISKGKNQITMKDFDVYIADIQATNVPEPFQDQFA